MHCPICGVDLSNMRGRIVFCPSCGNEIGSKLQNFQPADTSVPMRPTPSAQAEIPFDDSLNPTQNIPNTNTQPIYPPAALPGQVLRGGIMPGTNQPFQIVGFGIRLLAYIIDWIILSLITDWITSALFPGIVNQVNADLDAMLNYMYDENASMLPSFGASYYYLLLINFGIALLYYLLSYIGFKGRTAGKAICSLRAVDEQTMQPLTNLGRILIDVITKAAGGILLFIDVIIGVISSPGYQQKIRLSQKISKSIIIRQSRY